jgi:hypothetical protein
MSVRSFRRNGGAIVAGGASHGAQRFPPGPRLPDRPIFYPVLTEDYAVKIARDWNVPASGAGFVTRFQIKRSDIGKYEVQEAGGPSHPKYRRRP